MTPKALLNAVKNISGGTFIGLDTLTDVKLTGGKKNPQQGRVKKRMTGATVMAFTHEKGNAYEAMVHRRLEAEGISPKEFKVSERAWGTRLPNLPVVVHNKDGQDIYYLEVIPLNSGTIEYLLDGVVIDKKDIQGLPPAREPGPDAQGGLENQVILRDFKCESITALRLNGKEYT